MFYCKTNHVTKLLTSVQHNCIDNSQQNRLNIQYETTIKVLVCQKCQIDCGIATYLYMLFVVTTTNWS